MEPSCTVSRNQRSKIPDERRASIGLRDGADTGRHACCWSARVVTPGLFCLLLPSLLPRLKPFGDHEVLCDAPIRLWDQLQRLD